MPENTLRATRTDPEKRNLIGLAGRDLEEFFGGLDERPYRARQLLGWLYQRDVLELLKWVGLGERMYAYPAVLSGGEKQRAAIARAVIGKPELLLADEPTGNVDPALAVRLMRLFAELNRHGTTVLIATHDTGLISQVKTRLPIEYTFAPIRDETHSDASSGYRFWSIF